MMLNDAELLATCYTTHSHPVVVAQKMIALVASVIVQAILDGHPRSPLITSKTASEEDLDNFVSAKKFINTLFANRPKIMFRIKVLWNLDYREVKRRLGIREVKRRLGIRYATTPEVDDESIAADTGLDSEDWT